MESARMHVYSDGASGNRTGKPGGWAYVISIGEHVVTAGAGGSAATSNNIMEMTGALEGLKAAYELQRHPTYGIYSVVLISDSQVCLGLASGRYSPTMNKELAAELRAAFQAVRATDRWVRGHTLKKGEKPSWDVLMNDRCDRLAKTEKEKRKASLA